MVFVPAGLYFNKRAVIILRGIAARSAKFGPPELGGRPAHPLQVQIIICKFGPINRRSVFPATMKSQYGAVTMENYRHIGAGPPADTRYSDYRYRPDMKKPFSFISIGNVYECTIFNDNAPLLVTGKFVVRPFGRKKAICLTRRLR